MRDPRDAWIVQVNVYDTFLASLQILQSGVQERRPLHRLSSATQLRVQNKPRLNLLFRWLDRAEGLLRRTDSRYQPRKANVLKFRGDPIAEDTVEEVPAEAQIGTHPGVIARNRYEAI